jgi:hypothetical protein
MPVFKGTMIFKGPQHGWTESWWNLWPNTDYNAVMVALLRLATARNELLSNQTEIIGLRVSQEGLKNDGFSKYVALDTTAQSPACDSDEPDACVVAHAYDANYARKKAVFLRGIPDAIDIQFGKLTIDPCNWGKAFEAYLKKIVQGWGWMGRPAAGPTRKNVTGYTVDPDTKQIIVTFDGALFGVTPLNTPVTVTINGINKPAKSALSGQVIGFVDAANIFRSQFPIALFPYQSGGHGLYAPPEFVAATDMTLSRIGTRRVGAPLLASRGRGRARAKG